MRKQNRFGRILLHLAEALPGDYMRGMRGKPRPKSPIRSRWISFVPPPNVRMSKLR
jgi:hypothetical protein